MQSGAGSAERELSESIAGRSTKYQPVNPAPMVALQAHREILAKAAPEGFTPNDDADLGHLALLVPCKEDGSDCENRIERPESLFGQGVALRNGQRSSPTVAGQPRTPADNVAAWRARFAKRLAEH